MLKVSAFVLVDCSQRVFLRSDFSEQEQCPYIEKEMKRDCVGTVMEIKYDDVTEIYKSLIEMERLFL